MVTLYWTVINSTANFDVICKLEAKNMLDKKTKTKKTQTDFIKNTHPKSLVMFFNWMFNNYIRTEKHTKCAKGALDIAPLATLD